MQYALLTEVNLLNFSLWELASQGLIDVICSHIENNTDYEATRKEPPSGTLRLG
jgi:hypothetical protein